MPKFACDHEPIDEPETHAIHTGHKIELSLSPDISGPADTRGTWTFGIPRTGQLIPRSSDSVDEPWESVTAQHPESR